MRIRGREWGENERYERRNRGEKCAERAKRRMRGERSSRANDIENRRLCAGSDLVGEDGTTAAKELEVENCTGNFVLDRYNIFRTKIHRL